MKRIDSIDIVRGLVMIIMALDHTRDFMHVGSITGNPLDLATTTPMLFLSRWVTHFCAPVFVFLSGVSAYLSIKNRNNTKESRKFMISRGIWLIFLEFTVINFALWFDIRFRILLFQVIAAIGFGFILISFLTKVPPRILAIAALAIIFGHNFLSAKLTGNETILSSVLSPVLGFNFIQTGPEFAFVIAYPLIPWFGIMLAGFATGPFFSGESGIRKKFFIRTGSAALALFLILRMVNGYGDPVPWSGQDNFVLTLLSFVNTSKYPPSLQFILMTLGVMFILLRFAESGRNRFTDAIGVYGKVPFFYYLIHLYLIHAVLLVILLLQGFSWGDLSFAPFRFGRPETGESGVSLSLVILIWISIVALLYPLCRWYMNFKFSHKEKKWLRYL